MGFHFTLQGTQIIVLHAYAATYNILGYVPPGYNVLRTTLLQKEKANVERPLKPIKDS